MTDKEREEREKVFVERMGRKNPSDPGLLLLLKMDSIEKMLETLTKKKK